MDIATIDFWAVHGRSPLHRASAAAKLAAAALLIAAIVATNDLFVLVAIYLAVVAGIVLSGLPVLRLLALAAYPALFVLLFAASRWTGSLLDPLVILLKAVAAAATMVALIATTPYPQLFGLLRHLLPGLVADALFLTYRSMFILLGILGDLLTALRLRGGLTRRRYLQNSRNLATGLGLLLVRAISYSEQLYDVLRLRGYSGRLAANSWHRPTRADLLPLVPALVILAAVLFFRFAPVGAQYNGYLLLASVLAIPLAWRARRVPGRGTA
ncbi:MAG: CbiQ family ECF transporter T component [Chloroflexota bacterium]